MFNRPVNFTFFTNESLTKKKGEIIYNEILRIRFAECASQIFSVTFHLEIL